MKGTDDEEGDHQRRLDGDGSPVAVNCPGHQRLTYRCFASGVQPEVESNQEKDPAEKG